MPSIQHLFIQSGLTAVTFLLEKKCHQLVLWCFGKNHLRGLHVSGQVQSSVLPPFVKSQTQSSAFPFWVVLHPRSPQPQLWWITPLTTDLCGHWWWPGNLVFYFWPSWSFLIFLTLAGFGLDIMIVQSFVFSYFHCASFLPLIAFSFHFSIFNSSVFIAQQSMSPSGKSWTYPLISSRHACPLLLASTLLFHQPCR